MSKITPSAIGPQVNGTSSWLEMSIQVYERNASNKYMVYNFTTWKTHPNYRFTDAIGISVSDGMIISKDTSTWHAEHCYPDNGANGDETTDTLPVEINSQGNGVMAKFALHSAQTPSGASGADYNNEFIAAAVEYSNSTTTQGWICGNYLHKQLSFGGINMDAAGVPSVSYSISSDSCQGSVHVTPYD